MRLLKPVSIVAAFMFPALFALQQGCAAGEKASAAPTTQSGAVAVVELFTSEGCSSCPPADALLADLINQSDRDGRAVYLLAFHVDYWDHLGWSDPFDSRAYSERQQAYGRALKSDEIYTPQMIVNGRRAFVGSDRKAATDAINAALATPTKARLALTLDAAGAHYVASDVPPGAVINLAIVERGLSTEVKRGENGGRTLHHENVVRWFKTVDPAAGGRGTIELPHLEKIKAEKSSLIAYIQLPGPGEIVAATSQPLVKPL